jgi:hypothetical protein
MANSMSPFYHGVQGLEWLRQTDVFLEVSCKPDKVDLKDYYYRDFALHQLLLEGK